MTLYHASPQRFEAGTGNIADAVGLGAAIDPLDRVGIVNVTRHEHELLVYSTAALVRIPGVGVIGTAKEKASVLSFIMDGFRTEEIGDYLIARASPYEAAITARNRLCVDFALRAHSALPSQFTKHSLVNWKRLGVTMVWNTCNPPRE